MTKNINLPIVLQFSTGASAEIFREKAETIIPKLKSEQLSEENYVFYTRRDKNYRAIIEEWSLPETATTEEINALNQG